MILPSLILAPLAAGALNLLLASEGLGARKSWVITRHFARNVFSPVLVASTNSIASAILTESSLSYLGFGEVTIKCPTSMWWL